MLTQPAIAGDAAVAEALYRDGLALMDAGSYAAACPKLAESDAQDPATGTVLALAVCLEELGHTASAWATYAEAASRAKRAGQSDREDAAREHAAALEARLSRLTIEIAPEAQQVNELTVKRDGVPVGSATWGTAVPVDPGEHVVEASAPGKAAWKTVVTIAAGADAQRVLVPLLVDAEPGTEALSTSTPSADATPDEPEAAEGPPLRTIGLVVGGAGIVGLGVGGFFGLRAKSLNDESNEGDHCSSTNECDAFGGGKRDDAKSAATISTVAFVAGGLLAAGGVALFIVGSANDEPTAARLVATPVVGPTEAAVVMQGTF
jgi:hypothetical protein